MGFNREKNLDDAIDSAIGGAFRWFVGVEKQYILDPASYALLILPLSDQIDYPDITGSNMDENDILTLSLTGGVYIRVLFSDIRLTDGNASQWRKLSNLPDVHLPDTEALVEQIYSAEDPHAAFYKVWEANYQWAMTVYSTLFPLKGDHFGLIPYYPALAFKLFHDALTGDERSDVFVEDKQVLKTLHDSLEYWLSTLPTGAEAEENDRQLASTLSAYVRGYEGGAETFAEELAEYDSRLNHSVLFGKDLFTPENQEERIACLQRLCEAENAKERRIITCMTPPGRDARECGKRVPGVLVVVAQDLEAYNGQLEPAQRLRFQPGHPRTGVTYIQHPLRTNTYYDVDAFHANLLSSKHGELMYLLQCLGAKRVSLKVDHSVTEEQRQRLATQQSGGAEGLIVGGSFQRDAQAESGSTAALYQKLAESAEFTGNVEPHIPEDLVFFPHEEQWQRMAQTALQHGYRKTHVVLEYRQDYAINERYLSQVESALKTLFRDFNLRLKKDFTSEVKRITSTTWEYEVDFGDPGVQARPAAPAGAAPEDDMARKEALFLKRARRFAKNDGEIDEKEQAQLEKLAEELGIPRLRMEELIEDAFDD